jgi:hypothetical protein
MKAINRKNGFRCDLLKSSVTGRVHVRYTTGYMAGRAAWVARKDLMMI